MTDPIWYIRAEWEAYDYERQSWAKQSVTFGPFADEAAAFASYPKAMAHLDADEPELPRIVAKIERTTPTGWRTTQTITRRVLA
jgi:hypothetical protein